ncbi:MAG: NADH-quinone oxidoreductase subunit H, partial [Candidatus Omnitrophica bacterium]|nr:NADH-quinone oxidoreductase subunit H [Candidatus Omnitrophota bacterium]
EDSMFAGNSGGGGGGMAVNIGGETSLFDLTDNMLSSNSANNANYGGGGVLIEYSGLLLGIFKLTKMMLLYIMPLWLIILFFSSNLSFVAILIKYLFILLLIILIKNTNPRLRIDQALKFFWGPMTVLAVVSLILSLLGL